MTWTRLQRPLRRWPSALLLALLPFAAEQLSAQSLTADEVRRVVSQAAGQAQRDGLRAHVAVVDAELRLSPLGGVRNAQGCDISFRASDGVTPLEYEIRTYDGATGPSSPFPAGSTARCGPVERWAPTRCSSSGPRAPSSSTPTATATPITSAPGAP